MNSLVMFTRVAGYMPSGIDCNDIIYHLNKIWLAQSKQAITEQFDTGREEGGRCLVKNRYGLIALNPDSILGPQLS